MATTAPNRPLWGVELDGLQYVVQLTPAPADGRVIGRADMASDDLGVRATISLDPAGRPIISALIIDAAPGRGITAGDLRSFKLSELQAKVSDEMLTARDARWQSVSGMDRQVAELVTFARADRPVRANRIPDRTLRRVAELYLAEQHKGPGLRRRLARGLRLPASAEPTVRYWILRARAEGWLTTATHGQRAAAPGPRLIEYRDKEGQK